jgi:4-hydroxyphenylacetate 3-monooxygenase
MIRTSNDYLQWLKSFPIKVWYKGNQVHPLEIEKLRKQAFILADYYQHHYQNPEVNIVETEFGTHSITLLIPRTREDLVRKSNGYYSLAKNYLGIVGRSPDYKNAVLSTWAGCHELFGKYSENVLNYYKQMVEKDFFVTHSTSELKGGEKTGIRVIEEKENGLILSGARAMATAAALSDEIFIGPTRINSNEPEKAIVCSIPTSSPGLKIICRENFGSSSDLSNYFDESDAMILLDHVFVPWERVFIYNDTELYRTIVKETGTSLAASLQTNARAIAKLESVIELIQAWKTIYPKYQNPALSHTSGIILRDLQILKALQSQAIEESRMVHNCMQPNGETIEAAKIFFMDCYPRIISSLKQDLGPDLFYLFKPGDVDEFVSNELCQQWGITRNAFEVRQSVSQVLFDLLISTFGTRHELYERFYAGNPQNGVMNYWNNYSSNYENTHIFDKLRETESNFKNLL